MMSCHEMYRLPVINVPVPTNELNLPVGSEKGLVGKGFMYRLPKIQGTLLDDNESDILKQLEARQDSILEQLESLKHRVESLKENTKTRINDPAKFLDIVIHSSYHTPPYSVPLACRWLQERSGLRLFTSSHVHSSVKKTLEHLKEFLPSSNCQSRVDANVRITIIWKEDLNRDPECFVAMLPNSKIKGEVNLLRFLNRQFGLLSAAGCEDVSTNQAKSDEWLDRIHSSIIWGESKEGSVGQVSKLQMILEDIEKIVSKHKFLQPAKDPRLVDLIAYTSIKGLLMTKSQPKVIQQYISECQKYFDSSKQQNIPRSVGVIN